MTWPTDKDVHRALGIQFEAFVTGAALGDSAEACAEKGMRRALFLVAEAEIKRRLQAQGAGSL